MSNLVGVYLDVASDEKERIRKTAWNGLGLTFISNETRTILYFVLAVLAAVFGVLVAAFEDYPGAISKPWTVIIYDVWAEVVLFTVIILESSYPAKWSLWHFFSGALGMATSIGRACMIAAFVDPWTPILTHRDRFNAVGVGCMNAIKWVYPLMARPVDRLPGVRVGQPFHEVRDRGRGLNSHERAHPLDVVMTVCLRLPRPLKFNRLMDLTDETAATEMICFRELTIAFLGLSLFLPAFAFHYPSLQFFPSPLHFFLNLRFSSPVTFLSAIELAPHSHALFFVTFLLLLFRNNSTATPTFGMWLSIAYLTIFCPSPASLLSSLSNNHVFLVRSPSRISLHLHGCSRYPN